jgi:hypothetical protein
MAFDDLSLKTYGNVVLVVWAIGRHGCSTQTYAMPVCPTPQSWYGGVSAQAE